MKQTKILIFGQLTDITGLAEIHLNEVTDSDELIARLNEKYPRLEQSKFAIAIDKIVISQNTPIAGNSVIALLPPFSGG